MLSKFCRAARLSLSDWSYFLQAWFWLLFFDLALRVCPFSVVQAYAARPASRLAPATAQAERLIYVLRLAVDRARRRHLYPMTCLRRALTLQKLLAHRGIVVELKIGVRKDEANALSAHAWLEYQGNPLGEAERVTEMYHVMQRGAQLP